MIRAKFGTKRRYHEAKPRYSLSSRTVENGSRWAMAATLSGSVPIPWLVTRYSSSCLKNCNFSDLIRRFASFKRRNTSVVTSPVQWLVRSKAR